VDSKRDRVLLMKSHDSFDSLQEEKSEPASLPGCEGGGSGCPLGLALAREPPQRPTDLAPYPYPTQAGTQWRANTNAHGTGDHVRIPREPLSQKSEKEPLKLGMDSADGMGAREGEGQAGEGRRVLDLPTCVWCC
jgi:hypothetical protein